jgi:aerobic-type carbon monoxide dehydrogenase small subunit (CoxS/CutS family)
MKELQIEFNINGQIASLKCEPNRTLLEVLREDLGLTGAKDACGGEGECGACSVFFDDKLVNACMVFIGQVDGHSITTIEGITDPGKLHPLQKAFVEAGAVQCGFCTPGAVMSAKALLDRNPNPSDDEIRESLSGNLCRCTGYSKMVDGVRLAAKEYSRGR